MAAGVRAEAGRVQRHADIAHDGAVVHDAAAVAQLRRHRGADDGEGLVFRRVDGDAAHFRALRQPPEGQTQADAVVAAQCVASQLRHVFRRRIAETRHFDRKAFSLDHPRRRRGDTEREQRAAARGQRQRIGLGDGAQPAAQGHGESWSAIPPSSVPAPSAEASSAVLASPPGTSRTSLGTR